MLNFGVMVKKYPGMSEEQNREIAKAYVKQSQDAFAEDVAIWDNKVRIDNPILCEGDGPVYQLRQWYQQFYVDRAKVDPALADKMVFQHTYTETDLKPNLDHVDV
ncbi:unnamed protein product [Darwinula stevensoni]|uniref:3-ketosteroid-9-alpha-monooxygenase oxygenase component-like C-terminal domain-containing protein n=1 Tax=Darwinula stevensoni TaxID=69355 RepID=A0A7R9FU85_9CRUS|nr:unnamed protein product [Darwinula stevensoni]CAG0907247.1 unnamed protein product [Darwinula stevensoni]